jgi:hypothetical protein
MALATHPGFRVIKQGRAHGSLEQGRDRAAEGLGNVVGQPHGRVSLTSLNRRKHRDRNPTAPRELSLAPVAQLAQPTNSHTELFLHLYKNIPIKMEY